MRLSYLAQYPRYAYTRVPFKSVRFWLTLSHTTLLISSTSTTLHVVKVSIRYLRIWISAYQVVLPCKSPVQMALGRPLC